MVLSDVATNLQHCTAFWEHGDEQENNAASQNIFGLHGG